MLLQVIVGFFRPPPILLLKEGIPVEFHSVGFYIVYDSGSSDCFFLGII
jgi:hypothetical protein